MVAKAREGRLESDSLGFKGVDRDRVEDESWVGLPHRRPDEVSAGADCDLTRERIIRIRKSLLTVAARTPAYDGNVPPYLCSRPRAGGTVHVEIDDFLCRVVAK